MGVQISIVLMIASASSHSQLVDSQETSGKAGEQLSAIEQTAALVAASVEKELSEPVHHQVNAGTHLATSSAAATQASNLRPEAGQQMTAHRDHLARFLKTAIGNKQRELAEPTEQPIVLLRKPSGSHPTSSRQKVTAPAEGAMVKLLLSELSSLDIGRTKTAAGQTNAQTNGGQPMLGASSQSGANLLVSGRSALSMSTPGASPATNQRRQQQQQQQQQNRHIPCFFNAITCF